MALVFSLCSAPDNHIAFLHAQLASSRCYLEGKVPDLPVVKRSLMDKLFGRKKPISLPDGWPTQPPTLAKIDVNENNVGLYHRILNQGTDGVDGAGSLFQSWFLPHHSALMLDETGRNCAFYHQQLAELISLLKRITPATVQSQFIAWCDADPKMSQPTADEVFELFCDFKRLHDFVTKASKHQHGLVWVGRAANE